MLYYLGTFELDYFWGFPWLRYYFYFWDWYPIWKLRLSTQHGGSGPFWVSTWSGGSAFYSYHWDPYVDAMARVPCLVFLSFYLCVLWWIVVSLWWLVMSLWWMVSLIVLYFVSWIQKGWCNLFYKCIFFQHFIPRDIYTQRHKKRVGNLLCKWASVITWINARVTLVV